jgi:hypothetical protein
VPFTPVSIPTPEIIRGLGLGKSHFKKMESRQVHSFVELFQLQVRMAKVPVSYALTKPVSQFQRIRDSFVELARSCGIAQVAVRPVFKFHVAHSQRNRETFLVRIHGLVKQFNSIVRNAKVATSYASRGLT